MAAPSMVAVWPGVAKEAAQAASDVASGVASWAEVGRRRPARLSAASVTAPRPYTAWRRETVVLTWVDTVLPRESIVGSMRLFLSVFRSVAASLTATVGWANHVVLAALPKECRGRMAYGTSSTPKW